MRLRNSRKGDRLYGAAGTAMVAIAYLALVATGSGLRAQTPAADQPAAQNVAPPAAVTPAPLAETPAAPAVEAAPPSAGAPAAAPTPDASGPIPVEAHDPALLQPGAAQIDPQQIAPSGAPSPAQAAPAKPHSVDAAHLPRDLSPWSMFMAADIVVKGVMIGLAFASVVTWTVWLAKSFELLFARSRLKKAFAQIYAASSLAEAYQHVGNKRGVVPGLIELAALELRLSADVSDKSGIKERISTRLDGLAAAAGRDMNRGTGVLATIGSTAPFVGLFGTVWGIMNSFIGISESQTTNLAIVAPGIAEALLATAIGLVAAIPAVIVYNQFARAISGYKAAIVEASAEVMRLVSRDLDRGLKVVPVKAAV